MFIDSVIEMGLGEAKETIISSINSSIVAQDRIETQWPIYTVFYYLQILELYFENIAERQLLFDFFSMYLLTLHDKETRSIDPPILSSSSSSSEDEMDVVVDGSSG